MTDEERGVVVYASSHEAHIGDLVIAPSEALLSRLLRRDDPTRTIVPPLRAETAADVFAKPWHRGIILASPAVAVECALTVARGEDAPLGETGDESSR